MAAVIIEETTYEKWTHWPIHWSGIWVGALASLAALIVFALIGLSIGATLVGPESRVVDLKKIALGTLAFGIFSSFLAFVIGGCLSVTVAGIRRSEPAMLNGAIVWLVSVPFIATLSVLGTGSAFGSWYAGLNASPQDAPFERPLVPSPNASDAERSAYQTERTEYEKKVAQWRETAPTVVRNGALLAITGLLLGLMGSVLGGWMASGEPMNLSHPRYRTPRKPSGE